MIERDSTDYLTEPVHLRAGLIRIEWDKICRTTDCITLDGKPINPASAIEMRWPPERRDGGNLPQITVTQYVMPTNRQRLSEVVSVGYFVPADEWEAFSAWRREKEQ